jgi:hypothetical protein
MALPTTSLSFSALQTEYGNSNPISLSEYYRGGLNVPAGQTSGFGTIPTSGTINMGVFRGTTKVASEVVFLPQNGYQIDALFAGASQASAVFALFADGFIYYGAYTTTQSFVNSGLGSWITPTSAASNYEAFVTINSGFLSFGTVGSWVQLGVTNQFWRRTVGAGSVENATDFTIQIRKIGTATVLASAQIILNTSTDNQ